ncbi:hypothetical protein [Kutzneria sp. 744]|uniref:hypothetical protein n=1 Tax=Kutzneria sp. (strain 744) TaxID=345341 RepID=UPI0012FA2647|nr:hypothetical protein [Kutzneria sp. 744]
MTPRPSPSLWPPPDGAAEGWADADLNDMDEHRGHSDNTIAVVVVLNRHATGHIGRETAVAGPLEAGLVAARAGLPQERPHHIPHPHRPCQDGTTTMTILPFPSRATISPDTAPHHLPPDTTPTTEARVTDQTPHPESLTADHATSDESTAGAGSRPDTPCPAVPAPAPPLLNGDPSEPGSKQQSRELSRYTVRVSTQNPDAETIMRTLLRATTQILGPNTSMDVFTGTGDRFATFNAGG